VENNQNFERVLMRQIIAYFIKYPITGNVLMVVILLFGFLGLTSLKSTFFPESETKLIAIQLTYPGASPEEIEEGVVAKIEDNLEGVTGVDRVTSVSRENAGTVTVEIKRGNDIDAILSDVKNAVDRISSFPSGLEPPVIFKQETLTLALNFAVNGNVPRKVLKEYARQIENDLLLTDGISKVELSGFPDEEIEIALRESSLRAYGLTFDAVRNAVASANIETTGGTIKGDEEEILIRARAKEYYAGPLRDIVVATAADGRQVRLSEVAEVHDQWADQPEASYINGKPAIRISVNNTIDESLLFIADHVREYLEEFNRTHSDVQANILNDGSVLLRQRIALLSNNGAIGFCLVLLFLALFLQLRLAFWVALAIPISFAGMFMVGAMVGLQINVISLFGMIIVIGILVDDGIVIAENIYAHWERGKNPTQAAIDGTMEVLPAVLSAILTTMVAFGLFYFLAGVTGDFFTDISTVVILTLGFSLIEGALILPGHIAHSKALKREGADKKQPTILTRIQANLSEIMDWMRDKLYAPQLKIIFTYPLLALALPVAFLMISFGLIGGGFVKTTIFPVVEGDFLTVNVKMPAGTPAEDTKYWLDHIERATWRLNERMKARRPDGKDVVQIINQNTGPNNTFEGALLINLLDSEARQEYAPQKSSLAISDSIKAEAGTIYGADVVTYQLTSPFGKAVSVALYSNDTEQLVQAVEAFKDSLSEFSSLRNIDDTDQDGLRELNISLKDKARLLGLDLQQVVGQVRSGFFGVEVQRLQRGEDEVKVWVRYDERDRMSVGDLEDMRIRTSQGESYPLREIASISPTRGVIAINHLDGKREIRVEADVSSADVSTNDVLNDIEFRVLPPIIARYPSVVFSFEGQVRENAKTAASLKVAGPIVLILLITIILLTFRSVGQTVAVLSLIPFGLIGVIMGHWLLGKPFSFILSGLGVLALVGIMVNDALVLVSQFNTTVKEGKEFREALWEASLSRFRPIFLTSITTIAGLAPLILEKSLQAQFLIPMAIAVAFGLAVSTLLVLITLPGLLILFNAYKVRTIQLYTGNRPRDIEVEPAYAGRLKYYGLWLAIPAAIAGLFIFLNALFGA
jgi:multidrug efflux pump subunit AcrB